MPKMASDLNSTDSSLWSDLLYSTSNSSVYADSDLDFDGLDDWNSGGADGDLFYESYTANTGLSGVGRVSSAGVANRVGYAGYQWDQTISANHVRYRVYLPDIGRWTRRDPLGYVDGMALYESVRSCVLRYVDPMGLGKICYRPMPTPPVAIPQIRIPVPWYQFPGDELEPPEWWPDYIRTPGLIPSITVPSWLMQWWLRSLYPYLSPIQWWPEHQHIYYEDGLSPPNEGFFPDGVRPEKPNAPGPGRCTRTGLDDGRLRAAARYCRNFVGTFCVPGSYSLLTNNCQDFAQCVSDQYDRLTAQTLPGWGVPFLLKPFCY